MANPNTSWRKYLDEFIVAHASIKQHVSIMKIYQWALIPVVLWETTFSGLSDAILNRQVFANCKREITNNDY